jgi:hypothetical protein
MIYYKPMSLVGQHCVQGRRILPEPFLRSAVNFAIPCFNYLSLRAGTKAQPMIRARALAGQSRILQSESVGGNFGRKASIGRTVACMMLGPF